MKILKSLRYIKVAQVLNSLDGKTNRQAKILVNNLISNSGGIYSDNAWEGVNAIWRKMKNAKINYELSEPPKYTNNESGSPISKRWNFTVKFKNAKGLDSILYGVIVASGAGTVEDPLSRYDVVAYVS